MTFVFDGKLKSGAPFEVHRYNIVVENVYFTTYFLPFMITTPL